MLTRTIGFHRSFRPEQTKEKSQVDLVGYKEVWPDEDAIETSKEDGSATAKR